MRTIKNIVIHCTAGFGDVAAIRKFWKSKGWKKPGYHFFIYEDGKVEQLARLDEITNGVIGYNATSIHIAYQGGVDKKNVRKAIDTRTAAQKVAIQEVISGVLKELRKYQSIENIVIKGHRDFSPDKNRNGIIESWERIKDCPSFDAVSEYKGIVAKFMTLILAFGILVGCNTAKRTSITTVTDSTAFTSNYVERDTTLIAPSDAVTTFLECKDSVIYLFTDGEKVAVNTTTPIVAQGAKQSKISAQRLSGTNITKLDCICDTVAIQATLRDLLTSYSRKTTTKQKEYIPVKYIPRIVKILACIGGLTVFAAGFYFSFKLIKTIS